jgi:flagellar biosynthesis protein FlhF
MKLRRYIGKDMQEAMLKVKMELGNEAVILNTKKIRQKGLLKFFSKPLVELLVAVDEYPNKKEQREKEEKMNTEKERENEKTAKDVSEKKEDSSVLKDQENEKILQLESKVNNMESIINKVYEEIKKNGSKMQQDVSEKEAPAKSIVKRLFYNNLIKNDVEPAIADKVMEEVLERMGDSTNVNEAAGIMFGILSNMLGKPDTLQLREDGKPTVVVFLGPTGVGKTTTLAKIAADYSLNKKKGVALITADTYRIAAVDQLKTYADILGVPVTVVYSAEEVGGVIEKFSDKDLILIDTAGRSVKEKEQFEELSKLVEYADADEVYLVLSSTTSASNCKEIMQNYKFLEKYKLIFTKLDETSIVGVILNAKYHTNNKLSYLTTGQSVPDDIEIVDTAKLTKNLLGSIKR